MSASGRATRRGALGTPAAQITRLDAKAPDESYGVHITFRAKTPDGRTLIDDIQSPSETLASIAAQWPASGRPSASRDGRVRHSSWLSLGVIASEHVDEREIGYGSRHGHS